MDYLNIITEVATILRIDPNTIPSIYYISITETLSLYSETQVTNGKDHLILNFRSYQMPTKNEWINAIREANDIPQFGYAPKQEKHSEDEMEKTKVWAAQMAEYYTDKALKDGLGSSKRESAEQTRRANIAAVQQRRKEYFRQGLLYCADCYRWMPKEEYEANCKPHNHALAFMQWLEHEKKKKADLGGIHPLYNQAG